MSSLIRTKPARVIVNIAAELYTVPANCFAVAKVQVESGGECEINNKVVLKSVAYNVINSGVSPKTLTQTGALPSLAVPMVASAAVILPEASSDGQIGASAVAGSDTFGNSSASTTESAEFTLLEGMFITGTTGKCRMYIEEYPG